MSEFEVWNELGNIYYNTGAYDEAIRVYIKAIELDSGCARSYSNLASIYIHKGRHTEAISLLQKGIEFLGEATGKALLWDQMGNAYWDLNDGDNAIAAYRKAIELDPDNVTFQDNLAEAERISALITPESNIESSETVSEAETVRENPPAPDLPVEGPTCPGSEETSADEPSPAEIGTIPVFTLSETAESPESEAACWVFKTDEPVSSAEEATPENSPEPEPVILGSRIFSDVPVGDKVAEILDQTPEPIEVVEEPGTAVAQAEQDDVISEAVPETISQVEAGETGGSGLQMDMAENEIAGPTQPDSASAAPDPMVAEVPEVVPSPEIETRDSLDENSNTSPIGQPEMDGSTKSRANALLQMGVLHWRQGDYERASQFLNTAINLAAEICDNRFEALCLNAIALVKTDLGRIEEATRAYESAASLDPGHIFPWNTLGNLYSQLDRYEEAMTAFQKAIGHNLKDSTSWNGLGDVYHKLGRNEDAIAAYQLGNVFGTQNRSEDAITIYQTTIDADRENPRVWKEMGNVYYETGAYDDAINAYTKAIELLDEATDKAFLWNRLGDAYQQLENHDKAIAAYHKAVELDPNNATFQDNLAEAELAPENINSETDINGSVSVTEASQENFPIPEPVVEESAPSEPEEAVSTEPDSPMEIAQVDTTETVPEALPNLSNSDEAAEPEAAYWVFKASTSLGSAPQSKVQPNASIAKITVNAVKPSPVFTMPHFTDQALLNDHPLTEAQKDATVLLIEQASGTTKSSEMEYVRPIITQDDQKSIAPETEAVEASDTKPVKVNVINLQATMAESGVADQSESNLRNLEKDIVAYRRVTEINPNNDRAWDVLGNMYEAAGLHSEAIAAFERAIALDSRKEAYHYHLGLAHAAQMHYDKAIHTLKKVVALNPGYMLAHCALAGYYRRVGKEAEAQKHITIARPTMENENEYNQACFESICGNVDRAIECLKVALDKQQVQLDWARSDPDLDFIRTDPRFQALLHENGNYDQ